MDIIKIIGIGLIAVIIDIIITFPPKSTFEAIALSPESLHILTANSVKNAIPVILISTVKSACFTLKKKNWKIIILFQFNLCFEKEWK